MTSTNTETSTLTDTEFELAFTLRAMEEVLREFRKAVDTKFTEKGVLTYDLDQRPMLSILDTVLDFRSTLTPESLAVLEDAEVTAEVEDTLASASAAIAMENLGEALMEALGITDDQVALFESFLEGVVESLMAETSSNDDVCACGRAH